jgi:transposase
MRHPMISHMTKNKGYVPAPEVPAELEERFGVIRAVVANQLTVTEGAKRLGLSRNHFQTLLHRAMEGMLDGMSPKVAGRPAAPPREAALAEENERLRRENQRLHERVDTIDRLLGVAGDLLKGKIKFNGRKRQPRSRSTTTENPNDDEEDPEQRLAGATTMTALGMPVESAAAYVGRSAETLRRWRKRKRAGRRLVERPGPKSCKVPDATAVARVAAQVRELHGLVGAASLSHAIEGVSRRQAAAIKQATLTAMERERVAACGRVTVLQPGVVRGFDAMEVNANGRWWALISADAAVPYRTSALVTPSYNGRAVAEAIERDFDQHGVPLVWRADRARSHGTDEVNEVLDRRGVLVLHGPPHHPRYYGQLERQNREHRAWLDYAPPSDRAALENALPKMLGALNASWHRHTLDWRTAEQAWNARPVLFVDRTQLREEVFDKAARIRRHLAERGQPTDLADRLAIEQTLVKRGLLNLITGEWC